MNLFEILQTKPSPYHVYINGVWQTPVNITEIRNNVLREIDKYRINLSIQPIAYTNKAIDTDSTAQDNIKGKLQEIFAREAIGTPLPVESCFWKDADNIVHTFPDQATYKTWLQGLVIEISSRNTALYASAWTKKAEVDALTDVNDILNYDVGTGWNG